jgi:hypothetical protein
MASWGSIRSRLTARRVDETQERGSGSQLPPARFPLLCDLLGDTCQVATRSTDMVNSAPIDHHGRLMIGADFDSVLGAAQAGAEWAFGLLYRDINPALVRYFSARVPSAAEDLAADTWLAAAGQLRTFRGGELAFRAWLFTIGRRRMIQHCGTLPAARPIRSVRRPSSTSWTGPTLRPRLWTDFRRGQRQGPWRGF